MFPPLTGREEVPRGQRRWPGDRRGGSGRPGPGAASPRDLVVPSQRGLSQSRPCPFRARTGCSCVRPAPRLRRRPFLLAAQGTWPRGGLRSHVPSPLKPESVLRRGVTHRAHRALLQTRRAQGRGLPTGPARGQTAPRSAPRTSAGPLEPLVTWGPIGLWTCFSPLSLAGNWLPRPLIGGRRAKNELLPESTGALPASPFFPCRRGRTWIPAATVSE